MTERVSFASDGVKLAGVLHVPDGRDPRERRPGFLVLHGFGSNKDSGGSVATATLLADLGYVTLRFDMRGCGESEGPRGRVICLEQVEDTTLHVLGNPLVVDLVRRWLEKYFPASAVPAAAGPGVGAAMPR